MHVVAYNLDGPAMNRQRRLALLKRMVAQGTFRTQTELVDALRKIGQVVTQSSVSRDIHALGLEKVDGVYVVPGLGAGPQPVAGVPWSYIQAAQPAGPHLLVLRTAAATAQQVAAALDTSGWEGVVGTIAGDDTVFVATLGGDAGDAVRRRLEAAAGLNEQSEAG